MLGNVWEKKERRTKPTCQSWALTELCQLLTSPCKDFLLKNSIGGFSSPPASWLPLEHHRRNFGVILSLNPTLDLGEGQFQWLVDTSEHPSHVTCLPHATEILDAGHEPGQGHAGTSQFCILSSGDC